MMKQITFLLILLTVIVFSTHVNASRKGNIDKLTNSDTTDLIYTKAVGRYDRGILNYKFIPKKKWIGGMTIAYTDYNSDDSDMLFSLLQDFDVGLKTFRIKPFLGYALADNIIIGLRFGYNQTLGELGNVSIEIDEDLGISLMDIRYSEDLYSLGVFHRSYVGLDANKRFGLFNETLLSYSMGKNSFSSGEGEDKKYVSTDIQTISLGINPGVCVFIMENVSAEMSFGLVGFEYRSEKQENNKEETGYRRSSGADFKVNIFNINIGITFCI